jgi:hypothetical protein
VLPFSSPSLESQGYTVRNKRFAHIVITWKWIEGHQDVSKEEDGDFGSSQQLLGQTIKNSSMKTREY